MQSNQHLLEDQKVIDTKVWENLTNVLQKQDKIANVISLIDDISSTYNIETKNLIKDYLNYIIRYKSNYISKDFLNYAEFIMHLHDPKVEHVRNYSIIRLQNLLTP